MYKCEICSKVFETSRAYGGHKSSHFRGESYLKKRETEKSKVRRENKDKPKQCNHCGKMFENGWELGGHTVLCEMNPKRVDTIKKITEKSTGRKHTTKTKNKLSVIMVKAHKEGRAWNIGMSRWNNKPSYPESFFMKVIENEFEDKEYVREYPIGKYSIDFAWVHKKLAIEIDGSQHERFEDIKNRDIEKEKLLIEDGWKLLRIKWEDLCNETKRYIKISKEFIS